MHRAGQVWDDRQDLWAGGESALEGTFRTLGGAGEKIDVELVAGAQAQDGIDGVLLRATHDQPGDDVRDAHSSGRGSEGAAAFELLEAVSGQNRFGQSFRSNGEETLVITDRFLFVSFAEIDFGEL